MLLEERNVSIMTQLHYMIISKFKFHVTHYDFVKEMGVLLGFKNVKRYWLIIFCYSLLLNN